MQDEHSVENKMTAREFFTRFPSLHGFLLQELQRAATELATAGARYICMYARYTHVYNAAGAR